jgi:glycerol-3-phosphate O-acyltransferase
MMIPISISYERTLEELLFARELLGIPKPKESTSVKMVLQYLSPIHSWFFLQALFRARSILSENYGSTFVHIGKPVSLHGVCQQFGVSRIPHSLLPKQVHTSGVCMQSTSIYTAVVCFRERSGLLPDNWIVVEALGDIVVENIHCGMKVFPTSLVATALLQQPNGLQFGKYY